MVSIAKFRLWDKEKEKMVMVDQILYEKDGGYQFISESEGTYFSDSNIHVMCSLREQDKKGQDIFEEDICSCVMTHLPHVSPFLATVKRDERTKGFLLVPFDYDFPFGNLYIDAEGMVLDVISHTYEYKKKFPMKA